MELWKDVVGYEGLYLVSNKGAVISLPKEVKGRNKSGNIIAHRKQKYIKPHFRGKNGILYSAATLTKDGKAKVHSIHRLVAQAFIPNPDNLPEVNHIDRNPLNNHMDNLEWCTKQYNIDYSKAKKVEQYLDGEKIAEYKSITTASDMTGISRRSINNALTGWSKSAGGYKWRYEGSVDLSH